MLIIYFWIHLRFDISFLSFPLFVLTYFLVGKSTQNELIGQNMEFW